MVKTCQDIAKLPQQSKQTSAQSAGLRTRLWCNASLEFVLPLVALLLAVALKIFLHFREKQAAAAPKKGALKEKELLSWKKTTGQYLTKYLSPK